MITSRTSAMDRPVDQPVRGRLNTRIVVAALVLLAAIAVAVPFAVRWSRAERTVDASRIRIGRVTRGDLERDVAADGRVVAALHPVLYAPAPGTVALQVKAGTQVKKGQTLATVESPELVSRLAQERQTLLTSQSDLARQRIAMRQAVARAQQAVDTLTLKRDSARRALARNQALFDQGLMNQVELEKAQDDLSAAELELKNALQNVSLDGETARVDLDSRAAQLARQESVVKDMQRQADALTMQAPFDGMVATVSVQDRDAVTLNQAVLMVVNLDSFEVEFDLPENYARDATPGTHAEVVLEGRPYPAHVTAVSPEIRDAQVRGTVAFDGEAASGQLAPGVNPGAPAQGDSGAALLRPPAPTGLRQSQRVSVRLLLDRRTNVLKLPRGPFLESGGGRTAYVLDGELAVKRPVSTGAVSVSEVEVKDGLREGDQVVLSDTSVFDGARTVLLRNLSR